MKKPNIPYPQRFPLGTDLPRSTAIERVEYHPTDKILRIHIRGGGSYDYIQVPMPIYRTLITASSAGHFYSKYIKPIYAVR